MNFKTILISMLMCNFFGVTNLAYGDTYKYFSNSYIKDHNTRRPRNVTVKQCKSMCNKKYWCKSFDYHKGKNRCDLSDKTKNDKIKFITKSNSKYANYTKKRYLETGKPVDKELIEKILSVFGNVPKDKVSSMQWKMDNNGKSGIQIKSGDKYQLVHLGNFKAVKRVQRTFAANLGWSAKYPEKLNMTIKRKKGDGKVRYGDLVALKMSGYGWLKWKEQKYGINISDDDHTPHFIWKITGLKNGSELLSGMPFSLVSTRYNSPLVYCSRTHGINLAWE